MCYKLIILLFPLFSFGQVKFQPKIATDFFYPEYHLTFQNPMNNTVFTVDQGDFRTRLGLEATYKKFSVYFDQHLYMDYAGGQFDPNTAYWYTGARYATKYIKFQFEHLCIHPINTYSMQYRAKYYGGYNMISISYGY